MFYATSKIPHQQLENIYFQNLLSKLGWNASNIETLSEIPMNNLLTKINTKINEKLQSSCQFIYLTMNFCSIYNSSKFIGITGTWIDSNWISETINFGMIKCALDSNFSMKKNEIKRIFKKIQKLYQLEDKIISLTMEDQNEFISFSQNGILPCFRCGSNWLQMGAYQALYNELIKNLLAKLKFIVKNINNTLEYKEKLKKSWLKYAQKKKYSIKSFSQIPLCKSIKNLQSLFIMLENFLAYWQYILFVFEEDHWPSNWHIFTENELITLNQVRGFLEPLIDLHIIMEKKNIPTIPIVIPKMVDIIIKFYDCDRYKNLPVYQIFKDTAYSCLINYINYMLQSSMVLGILFLNPQLQNFHFIDKLYEKNIISFSNDDLIEKAKIWIREQMSNEDWKDDYHHDHDSNNNNNNYFSNLNQFNLDNLQNETCANVEKVSDELIDEELRTYSVIVNIPANDDLIGFWKTVRTLKVLPNIAKKYLLIPISTVDVDESFSQSANNVHIPKKDRISPDLISQFHFLNANQHFFDSD